MARWRHRVATRAAGIHCHHRSPTMDRRDFLNLTAVGGGAVFASGLAGCADARRRHGAVAYKDFYFVQLSDTHWGYQGPANPDAAGDAAQGGGHGQRAADAAGVHRLHRRPDAHHRRPCRDAGARLAEFKTIVADLKVKTVRFMPGEHDASLDRGAAFKEFFGDTLLHLRPQGRALHRASTTCRTPARRSATSSSPG